MADLAVAATDLPPPPRMLRRRPGTWGIFAGRWFLRLFILPHTIIGAGLLLTVLYLPVQWLLGETIAGKITGLPVTHGKSIRYEVHYTYAVGGRDYAEETTVSPEIHSQLQLGQPYPVRVFTPLPSALPIPLGPGSSWWDPLARVPLALFWNGILSVFLWISWIAPWRQRQLLKWGPAAPGVIRDKQAIRGKGTTYKISYTYEAVVPLDPDGISVSHQSLDGTMCVRQRDFESAQCGQQVTVVYDANKPKRSVIHEFAEYEAVA